MELTLSHICPEWSERKFDGPKSMDRVTDDFERRLRAGDPDAVQSAIRLVLPAGRRLLRTGFTFRSGGQVYRFSGGLDPFDVDDLLQTAVSKAFSTKGLATYDGIRPVEPWFLQILRNCVIDELRRADRKRLVLVEPAALSQTEPDIPAEPVLDALDREQLAAIIAEFRDGLASDEALVLRERFEHQCSQRDCATRTGLTRSQVRTIESRLRMRLAALLKKRGWWSDDDV